MFGVKGFNIVIGNPPYVQIEKGKYSSQIFSYSEGRDKGKQNLYKLFIELSYNLLLHNGISCMIVQSSLLCDLSSSYTRLLLLENTVIHKVIEFPKQTSDPRAQVFGSVLQGTCICIFAKTQPIKSETINISSGNNLITVNSPQFEFLNQASILSIYPEAFYIPLLSKGESAVMRKINEVSVPFLTLIKSISQGDLNLTSHASQYSNIITSVKLYRGRNVQRYKLLKEVNEFVIEGFRDDKIKENLSKSYIVMQEITGTTDRYRLHACLTDTSEKFLFGHTVNKIELKDQSIIKDCLAILNSSLMDWFFRKTSTNNHVMGYEIKQLPFPLNLSNSKIALMVDKIIKCKENGGNSKSLEDEVENLIFKEYKLNDLEIEMIKKNYVN